MSRKHSFAIGVVSYQRGLRTNECIESIRANTVLPYHIYIADNASTDVQTRDLLLHWETADDITVIRLTGNQGPAAGRNSILNAALGIHNFLAMLDNDVRVLPHWDLAAASAFDAGFDVVQPKLLSADCARVDRGPTRAWPEKYLVHPEYLARGMDRHASEVSLRIRNATFGGTAVLQAQVYEEVGYYDESLWVAEDYDLSYRTSGAGFRICYEPSCEMVHDHGWSPDYESIRFDARRLVQSHLVMWSKHERLLLPPSDLLFYRFLLRHRIPAVRTLANSSLSIISIWQRLQRRLARTYYDRYGHV